MKSDFNFSELNQKLTRGAALITAGTLDDYNSMAIGWGTVGRIWSVPVFIAFVRPSRYTYEFVEKNDYFSISFYDRKYARQMGFFGTKSGRDVDKAASVDFHPIACKNSVTYEEAELTIVCRKIYYQDLNNEFGDEVMNKYYNNDSLHRFYVGEIVETIEN